MKTGGKFAQSGNSAVTMIALILLGIALIGCAGVFGLEYYLSGVAKKKAAQVAATEAAIDTESVEAFIRTRDRFIASQDLLDRHVRSSDFFVLLDKVTLQTVRFSALAFSVAEDRSATIQMTGTARTFNALAAQSSLLAGEKYIKRAIFANITVNDNGTVSFTLDADVDADLITESVAEVAPLNTSLPIETMMAPASTTPTTGSTTPAAGVMPRAATTTP